MKNENEKERINQNHENKKKLEEEKSKLEERREAYKIQLRNLRQQTQVAKEKAQSGLPEDVKAYEDLKHQTADTEYMLKNTLFEIEEWRKNFNERVYKHNNRILYKTETKDIETKDVK